MASIDLITPAYFYQTWATNSIATLDAAQQAALPGLITSASRAFIRYCRRYFTVTDLNLEVIPRAGQWDKNEPDIIDLPYTPIAKSALNPIVSLRCGRTTAIQIVNGSSSVQDAYFYLNYVGDPELGLPTFVGVTLMAVSSGVVTTNSFPFFGTPTSTGFSVAASGSGSSLAGGTYLCSYSNVNAAGESVRSADVSVPVTAGQNLVFTLPSLIPQAASNNVYVSTTNGASSTETVQNAAPVTSSTFTVPSLTAGATFKTTNTGTCAQLAAAVAALGGGWSATIPAPSQFNNWTTTDLLGACGATMPAISTGQATAIIGLDVYPYRLAGAQVLLDKAIVLLPQYASAYGQGPGNVQQWPGSIDQTNSGSIDRDPVLVRYAAGFATIPEDVQEACVEQIKFMFERLDISAARKSETVDKFKWELAMDDSAFPPRVKRALAPYRMY